MLSVVIRKDFRQVASLSITRLETSDNGELADYQVQVMVERGNDIVGVQKRILENFPRNAVNSIGLLKAALNLFDPDSLGLDDDYDSPPEARPSDMARRLSRTQRAIQAGKG